MQLQKEVKSNPKNSPAVKKVCGLCCEKRCEIPRNGCDGRLKGKILITTIQVNLVPNHSEMWRRQHKFTWIVVIKFLFLAYHHNHFLATTLDFTSFFTTGAAHFFIAGLFFGLDNYWHEIQHCKKENRFSWVKIHNLSYLTNCQTRSQTKQPMTLFKLHQ